MLSNAQERNMKVLEGKYLGTITGILSSIFNHRQSAREPDSDGEARPGFKKSSKPSALNPKPSTLNPEP